MKYKSKAYTYLCISGQNLIETDIYDKIKIRATSTSLGKTGIVFWKYRIDAQDALEGLELALNMLIEVFNDKVLEIKELAKSQNLYVKVFVVTHVKLKESGGLFLSRKTIEFLNTIEAELEFDYYI